MALNDLLGLGKVLPINKLIDVISGSVGRISKSYFYKKDANAKAYEIKKLAEARAEEMKIMSEAIKDNFQITGGIEYKDEKIAISSPKELPSKTEQFENSSQSLEKRAQERINFKQNKKQLNIESVTSFAAEELKNEQPVTDEPLDEDWTTRFFNIVEDISHEEMQSLWGRILAGEIIQPKSYSLRTLELLKNLSKEEAEIFTKFASLKIVSGADNFIYNPDNGEFLQNEFGIKLNERLLLTELGLIVSEKDIQFTFKPTQNEKRNDLICYGTKGIAFYRNENTPGQNIPVIVFTKSGTELSKLICQAAKLNYIEKICSSLKHPNVKIEYGDIITDSNEQIILLNKVEYNK